MRSLAVVLTLLLAFPLYAKDVRVRGTVNKKGKYVKPHSRTKADRRKDNNWSAKGNVNPWTGKRGSKQPGP